MGYLMLSPINRDFISFSMPSENFVVKKKRAMTQSPPCFVIPSEVEGSSFAASGDSSTPLGMTHRLKLSCRLYGGISLAAKEMPPQGRHIENPDPSGTFC